MGRRQLRFAAMLAVCTALLPLALGSRALALVGARRAAVRCGAAVQRRWARGLLRVLGLEVVREGDAPRGALVVVANHLSYLDIPVLASLFPGRFVAKSEIAGWPVLGPLAATVGTIFIAQGRSRDLVRVERQMDETLAAGVPVLLFPEGHSTRGLTVDRLHSSLLECTVRGGVRCLAVTLGYETPGEPWAPAATVCWWGGMGFWRHAWNLVGLARIRASVRIGEVPVDGLDRKERARRLHAEVLARFRPLAQEPIAPDYPWPELFRAADVGDGGPARAS